MHKTRMHGTIVNDKDMIPVSSSRITMDVNEDEDNDFESFVHDVVSSKRRIKQIFFLQSKKDVRVNIEYEVIS